MVLKEEEEEEEEEGIFLPCFTNIVNQKSRIDMLEQSKT